MEYNIEKKRAIRMLSCQMENSSIAEKVNLMYNGHNMEMSKRI